MKILLFEQMGTQKTYVQCSLSFTAIKVYPIMTTIASENLKSFYCREKKKKTCQWRRSVVS